MDNILLPAFLSSAEDHDYKYLAHILKDESNNKERPWEQEANQADFCFTFMKDKCERRIAAADRRYLLAEMELTQLHGLRSAPPLQVNLKFLVIIYN